MKTPSETTSRPEDAVLAELAGLADEPSRQRFFARHPSLLRAEFLERLLSAVQDHLRVDVSQALALAEAAVAVAQRMADSKAVAQSLRAKANALYFAGQHRSSVDVHEQSLSRFRELSETSEIARTLTASIQPLVLLGDYEHAFAAADEARRLFTKLGESRRLARLDNNVGNILHRQDRFAEAAVCYERAYQGLLEHKDTEGIAVALHNMAVCLIGLNDFRRALDAYQKARSLSERHGLPLLTVQADYNIAYLYFLRGEYSRAIEGLSAAREASAKSGDAYHSALCNLDQSEIYLELNLIEEAAEMAEEAAGQFQRLGMGYETAKSLAFLAIALSRQKKTFRALELFKQARSMFVNEKNSAWPSLIDLYQALVLQEEGRLFEAHRLCSGALEFFRASPLASKAALCWLLLARLSLRIGDISAARRHCTGVLNQLEKLESPDLTFKAHFLMGRVDDAVEDREGAYSHYQAARQSLETLRSSLRGEELKIAFMTNRLEVYERLVELCLAADSGHSSAEEALGYIEQAKSRSLKDILFGRTNPLPARRSGQSALVNRIREMREELNWYYHRIELEQLGDQELSPERVRQLETQARAHEDKLLHALRGLSSSEPEHPGFQASPLSLAELQGALVPGTTLVEYYCIDDRVIAAVMAPGSLEMVPLTVVSRLNEELRMLQFQLSKFLLGADYATRFGSAMLRSTQAHLKRLYEEILAPLVPHLKGSRLIVVPHGILHYVPFQALFDGEGYVVDTFAVSYAPSASVYALCTRKQVTPHKGSLVLGVPDPQAPFIRQEAEAVAAALPEAELFIGSEASEAVLRKKGPHCGMVHIATHGYFRQDNPMFSAVRLGDTYLTQYDLYHLELPVELVALSGCATGLNVIASGDELLGLVRGLLYAGAQSLLLTLWDVHDKSTAEFMATFYRLLSTQKSKSEALRQAMLQLRDQYPHPYYWAPFVLVGKG